MLSNDDILAALRSTPELGLRILASVVAHVRQQDQDWPTLPFWTLRVGSHANFSTSPAGTAKPPPVGCESGSGCLKLTGGDGWCKP
jgi:hypothetical protein